MKKTLLLAFLFSLITITLANFAPHLAVSAEVEPLFARVKYNNVYLYKTPTLSDEVSNVYFLLEQSYFVKVTAQIDDNFFEASYMDVDGFVKQSEIEFIANAPQNPFLNNITFNTNLSSSVILRSAPSSLAGDATALKVLAPNSQNLVYYGKIAGQEATAGLGNIWYFAEFTDSQNNSIKGYVYSPLTYNLTPILPNSEVTTIANFNELNQVNTFLNIAPSFRFVIIVLVVLPTLLILYLFFKPSKIAE